MALIAVASVSILGAFGGVLNSERRATDSKNAAADVESRIVSGAAPSGTENTSLEFGGYRVEAAEDTYTSGRESYTVLGGANPVEPFTVFFGDFGGDIDNNKEARAVYEAISALGYAASTGPAGGALSWRVSASGRYLVEAWGAGSSVAAKEVVAEDVLAKAEVSLAEGKTLSIGKGSYNQEEVSLAAGDSLTVDVGGYGGSTEIVRDAGGTDGLVICRAAGGIDGTASKADMPDPLDTGFDPKNPEKTGLRMLGNDRGGFVRITYLGS
ncbi:MAG: hypothetical protein LBR00_07395 [Clostridiales Family XIII bacterium]|nr:hypothetical protein [Clostridiales Family XIII bacterium]